MRIGDPAKVEAELAAAMEIARAAGVDLVFDAPTEHDESGRLTGVCAIQAHEHFLPNEPLSFSDGDRIAIEWDSIEYGFDGVDLDVCLRIPPLGLPTIDPEWWRVGRSLRDRFAPRKALADT